MFDFFGQVIGYIEVAFQYLVNIISALGHALVMVQAAVTIPSVLVGFVPTIIASAMIVFPSIMLIKFIVGR